MFHPLPPPCMTAREIHEQEIMAPKFDIVDKTEEINF